MPAAKISLHDWPELVRLHVREKLSHKAIAQRFGCHPSVVTRTLKRVPVVELVDAEHRKMDAARRSQEYRDRKAEREREHFASEEATVERITGQPSSPCLATLPGQPYPRLERESPAHAWRYIPQVGWNRWATFEHLQRFKVKNPEGAEGDPGFGDIDYPRHPVGYIPPDQRVVCRMSRVTDSGATVTSPVQARDLEARIAQGWQRV
jgi:hypothetical protein